VLPVVDNLPPLIGRAAWCGCSTFEFCGYRCNAELQHKLGMADDAFDLSEKFDAERAADTLGLTGKLRGFAFARWRGANMVDAARAAGYGGTDATLRSSGSKANKSPKVQNFLRWAATGKSMPDEPGDLNEIVGKLWSQVRSTDVAAQRFAIDQLVKLNIIQPSTEGAAERWDVFEALEEIASLSPLVAAVLAQQHGLDAPAAGERCLKSLCPDCLAVLVESIGPAFPRARVPFDDTSEVGFNGHTEAPA
jgi:hypothetical protein